MDRVREKGTVVGHHMADFALWLRVGTVAQANRIMPRLHGITILNGTVALEVHQTTVSAWPSASVNDADFVPLKRRFSGRGRD